MLEIVVVFTSDGRFDGNNWSTRRIVKKFKKV